MKIVVVNFNIYHPGEDLIAPCHCKGTQKYVHRSCLDNWRSAKVNHFISGLYSSMVFLFPIDWIAQKCLELNWCTLYLSSATRKCSNHLLPSVSDSSQYSLWLNISIFFLKNVFIFFYFMISLFFPFGLSHNIRNKVTYLSWFLLWKLVCYVILARCVSNCVNVVNAIGTWYE